MWTLSTPQIRPSTQTHNANRAPHSGSAVLLGACGSGSTDGLARPMLWLTPPASDVPCNGRKAGAAEQNIIVATLWPRPSTQTPICAPLYGPRRSRSSPNTYVAVMVLAIPGHGGVAMHDRVRLDEHGRLPGDRPALRTLIELRRRGQALVTNSQLGLRAAPTMRAWNRVAFHPFGAIGLVS